MKRTRLSDQMKRRGNQEQIKENNLEGNTEKMISTGSTLLDLAISGGRVRGGGLPAGIFVEIFGPSASGKTAILCEIAGAVLRQEGDIFFHDPEARLNKQFAKIFDFHLDDIKYSTPDTVTQVFQEVRAWNPEPKEGKAVNGIFTDSLAALSTDLEMGNEEGDKMGMRRAKEFSEELRKTCRIIKKHDYLMVTSNQVRENADGMAYTPKYRSPGGEAIGFYSSLRLRITGNPEKIVKKKSIAGKEVSRVIGVKTNIEVYKNSVWEPYRTAPVHIYFKYGIDDIRANLQFIKDYTNNNVYTINDENLDKTIEKSIQAIEDDEREEELREQVIDLWEEIEDKFKSKRKPKRR